MTEIVAWCFFCKKSRAVKKIFFRKEHVDVEMDCDCLYSFKVDAKDGYFNEEVDE